MNNETADEMLVVPVQSSDPGALFQGLPRSQQKTLWAGFKEKSKGGEDRFKISELFVDERCSQAILDFLATTDVGSAGRGGR